MIPGLAAMLADYKREIARLRDEADRARCELKRLRGRRRLRPADITAQMVDQGARALAHGDMHNHGWSDCLRASEAVLRAALEVAT